MEKKRHSARILKMKEPSGSYSLSTSMRLYDTLANKMLLTDVLKLASPLQKILSFKLQFSHFADACTNI